MASSEDTFPKKKDCCGRLIMHVDGRKSLLFGPPFIGSHSLGLDLMGAWAHFCPGIQPTPAKGAKEIDFAFYRLHRLLALGASCFWALVSVHFTLSRKVRTKGPYY